MTDWAEAISRREPVVVEQNRTKVRLVRWGLAVPATILTFVAVLAPTDLWGHLIPGASALVLWWASWVFRSNIAGPNGGRLVVGGEGLELPRKGGTLILWKDIARVGLERGVACLWLTPEGYERFYAHLPGWLRTLNLINMRGLRLPRTFEAGADEVFALIDNQHKRYGSL